MATNVPVRIYLSPRAKKKLQKLAEKGNVSQGTIVATAIEMFEAQLIFQEGKSK